MKRAMRRRIIAYLTVILLIFGACEKDDERIDNFLVEFATVIQTADRLTFQLENFKTLVPIYPRGYSGKDGQRVILNYSPLRGDTIQINSVNDIFTGIIRESDDLSTLIKDPVKIQSVWVGGNHLNMILEIEYFEKDTLWDCFATPDPRISTSISATPERVILRGTPRSSMPHFRLPISNLPTDPPPRSGCISIRTVWTDI